MLEPGFYNMDCMEGMKQFPDNYFDLAIVDPPYGDARGGAADRFGERFDRYKYHTGGGWHGKQKYNLNPSDRKRGKVESQEPAGAGRRDWTYQKNHIVGCCPEAGVF